MYAAKGIKPYFEVAGCRSAVNLHWRGSSLGCVRRLATSVGSLKDPSVGIKSEYDSRKVCFNCGKIGIDDAHEINC